MRSFWILPLLALSVATSASGADAVAGKPDAPAARTGRAVPSFTLKDGRGKDHSLADLADAKLVVVAFVGTECPLAKLYGPRLAELAKEYGPKGVAFLALDSNTQDSPTEILHYQKINALGFPVLKDVGNVVADQMKAERTPEVHVLDRDRVARYVGRIDDQFGFMPDGSSYQRSKPIRRDLAEALDQLLAGQPVAVANTKVSGCLIGRAREPNSASEVTFARHIAPIFNDHCVSCHRPGQIGPFSLSSYEDAAGWAEMIQEVVTERRMPPWHADPKIGHWVNDARLPDQAIDLITTWVKNGAPLGDPKEIPPPPQFAEKWMIPEPDEVLYMADEPYTVPAEGVVQYQRFIVDPGWKEDRWVKAIEPRPGNSAVVHHIIVYLRPPTGPKTGAAGRLRADWLGAYAPGLRQEVLPDELARYVPAGSTFIIELHYTPNGTEQTDRSYVGFKFADPSKVKKEIVVRNAGNFTFKIPPRAKDYQVESEFKFTADSVLHSLSPHMHLRGKSFRYDAVFPDGKTQTLLWVPRYDFGWQTTYQMAEPLHMPKGSALHCVAWFDNSEDNLANPDPNSEVTWGEQTWEEMMFGWFEMTLADQDLTKPQPPPVSRVKEFLAQHAASGSKPDAQLVDMAKHGLEDEKKFELFAYYLRNSMPQLDRVCISYEDKGKLRLLQVQEIAEWRTTFRTLATRVKGEGEALSNALGSTKPVVFAKIDQAPGTIMKKMAGAGIKSSLHLPVTIDGKAMTVNFWSGDEDAFPPEAVDYATQVARFLVDGSK